VESAKVRLADDGICTCIEDRLNFLSNVLSQLPQLLLLIDRVINDARGLLNGVQITSHPDFSAIYDDYMNNLCRKYNVQRVGLHQYYNIPQNEENS